jgi:starch synthase
MDKGLKVCFVAAEAAPFASAGGLGEVASGLPRALAAAGHDVRVFVPLHRRLAGGPDRFPTVAALQDVGVVLGPSRYTFSARAGHGENCTPRVLLVDCPALYDRAGIYTDDEDEHLRFALLARAVIESCRRLRWTPDVVHCNDWHTALIPLWLRTLAAPRDPLRDSRSLLTIHNLAYQGVFPADAVRDLALQPRAAWLDADDLRAGRFNFLRTGVRHADGISTVSPTYAREILTASAGRALDAELRARSDRPVGILNGVDLEEWDPARDRLIPHAFSAADPKGKSRNKRAFADRESLEVDPATPLVAIVSRMVEQKGFDLCFGVLPDLLESGRISLAAMGAGEPRLERFFAGLAHRHPKRAWYRSEFDRAGAHLLLAAADLLLVPSRFEPCGLTPMYGLRYGVLPVARRTGGLSDIVRPTDDARGCATGFLFGPFTSSALREAIEHALASWADPAVRARMLRNAMAERLGWNDRVPAYVELYRRLLHR